MAKLILIMDDEGAEIRELTISNSAFTQLSGECPILKLGTQRFTYLDASDECVEYQVTREFTINDVDHKEAVLFETADPENSL